MLRSDWLVDRLGREECAAAAEALQPLAEVDHLSVTGHRVPISVQAGEVETVYAPVALLVLRMALACDRVLVAVAGVPGSGKSVFAELLARAVTMLDRGQMLQPTCLGLDGFHRPNAELLRRTVSIGASPAVAMKVYKGAEFTYDAEKAKEVFATIRSGRGRVERAPAYDRGLHDPVPDAVAVPADCRVVVVEGNYLLLGDGPWRGMPDLFDLKLYLDAKPEHCKPDLITRHQRGGRSQPDAEQHYERVDLPNTRVVLATRPRADLVLQKAEGHRVLDVLVQNPQRLSPWTTER